MGYVFEKLKAVIRGEKTIQDLEKLGFTHGGNFHAMQGCIIDPGHCMLIEIGNNVTLAPRVHVLAHDASTKMHIGYTRIAKTTIGDNVFIGAGTVILPGVQIGDNVIVGAGSIVTKSLSSNGVYAGNPARKIVEIDDYLEAQRALLSDCDAVFGNEYSVDNADSTQLGELKKRVEMAGGIGFIE